MRRIESLPKFQHANSDLGSSPVLQWVDIDNLVVDDKYQRPLIKSNWNQIKRIAENFSWSMFSAVFVAPIEGGKFAIIDGQHRTHAALICGAQSVPCLIVQADRAEQARAFAAVNGMVTKVSPLHIFNAKIAGGDEDALKLNELVRSCGFRIMRTNNSSLAKKFGELYAIGTLEKINQTFGADVLAAALLSISISETCNSNSDHHPSIIWSIAHGFSLHFDFCKTPTIISDRIDQLDVTLDEVLEQANSEAKAMRRRGGLISGKARLVDLIESKLFARAKECAA